MTSPRPRTSGICIEQAYHEGFSTNGDLGLHFEQYADHVRSINNKHPEAAASRQDALRHLHAADLYLAVACAQISEVAWKRFDSLYRRRIYDAARIACATPVSASDLAESLPGHLFLPGASGKPRIAGYDGRSSLATWLAAIITNLAIRERQRNRKTDESLDSASQFADGLALERIEASLRAARFGVAIRQSMEAAALALNERESLLLLLHYEDSLRACAIAARYKVHPSTIGRQIKGAQERLKEETFRFLRSDHGLTEGAIDECITEILENPVYSMLALLRKE